MAEKENYTSDAEKDKNDVPCQNRYSATKSAVLIGSQEYLEQIFSQIPGNVFWQDCDGIILGCNDQQAKCLGYNYGYELIGKTPYDLLSKEDAELVMSNNRFILEQDKPYILKEEPANIGGKKRTFYTQKVPLKNISGSTVGILGMSIDITELKEAEQEKLQGMAAASSTIAHEIRTPLASINSAINGLKKYFPALLDGYLKAEKLSIDISKIPPKHLEQLLNLLDDIQSELLSANTIINMLLQNIKLPKLKIDELSPCLISRCIDEAINRYPFSSDKQAQLIHLNYTHEFSFMGNQLLMIHILFNLIKNALYAIDMAGKGKIYIWTESNSDQNILYFRDTGKGISQSILPKLFDRFFTTSSHGTGLGLSFSKRVMEAFGGNITCESVEGEFTLFKLSFPVIKDG